MQNHSQIKDFCEKFDRYFKLVCSEIGQTNSFDLIGTEHSLWKYLVNEKGVVTIETQYNPPYQEPQIYEGVRRTLVTMFSPETAAGIKAIVPVKHFCLDGYLPVSVILFDSACGQVTEYALADSSGDLLVKLEFAQKKMFFKTLMPLEKDPGVLFEQEDPQIQPSDESEFETALAQLKSHWEDKLRPVLQWDFPHAYLKNGILAAFVKAFLSQYDNALRYGATRYYCDAERTAESFPPTVLTMAEACRFFGLQDEGEKFLSHFVRNFISQDGEIIHRGNGASLSEHGMLLELSGRLSKRFQEEHKEQLSAVAKRLLKLITDGQMIDCCPEDDLRDFPHQKWFSCNFWVVRGLEEYNQYAPLEKEKTQALAIFRSHVLDCCRASAVPTENGTFIPPFPGWDAPFEDMNDFIHLNPEEDIHSLSSYTNYRFYPEMLSSCIPEQEIADAIINYRKTHGGDFHGATAFRIFKDFPPYASCLDDWPLYNYLRGLIHYGQCDEFIRLLAGHMALHQGRGTYFAPEMSFKDRLDSTHCVPSQLTLPLALSYLLQ